MVEVSRLLSNRVEVSRTTFLVSKRLEIGAEVSQSVLWPKCPVTVITGLQLSASHVKHARYVSVLALRRPLAQSVVISKSVSTRVKAIYDNHYRLSGRYYADVIFVARSNRFDCLSHRVTRERRNGGPLSH